MTCQSSMFSEMLSDQVSVILCVCSLHMWSVYTSTCYIYQANVSFVVRGFLRLVKIFHLPVSVAFAILHREHGSNILPTQPHQAQSFLYYHCYLKTVKHINKNNHKVAVVAAVLMMVVARCGTDTICGGENTAGNWVSESCNSSSNN